MHSIDLQTMGAADLSRILRSDKGKYLNDLIFGVANILRKKTAPQLSIGQKIVFWTRDDWDALGGDEYTRFIREYMQEALIRGPYKQADFYNVWKKLFTSKGLNPIVVEKLLQNFRILRETGQVADEVWDPRNNPISTTLDDRSFGDKVLGEGKTIIFGAVAIYALVQIIPKLLTRGPK